MAGKIRLISHGCFHCSPGLTVGDKISPKARSLSGNKLAVILVVPNSAFPSDLVSSSPSTFPLFPPPFHSIPRVFVTVSAVALAAVPQTQIFLTHFGIHSNYKH